MKNFLKLEDAQVVAVCDVNRGSYGYRDENQFCGREPARKGRTSITPRRRPRAVSRSATPTPISARCSPAGHRRGGHRRARPLARRDDRGGLQGRQGHLLRKAALADDPAGPGDGQGRPASTSGSCKRAATSGPIPDAAAPAKLVRNGRIGQSRRSPPSSAITTRSAPARLAADARARWFRLRHWLGPAPLAPYHKDRCLYRFRFIYDYSGGQITNYGAHPTTWPNGPWAPTTPARWKSSSSMPSSCPREACSTPPPKPRFRCRYANGVELVLRDGQIEVGARFEGHRGHGADGLRRLLYQARVAEDRA